MDSQPTYPDPFTCRGPNPQGWCSDTVNQTVLDWPDHAATSLFVLVVLALLVLLAWKEWRTKGGEAP